MGRLPKRKNSSPAFGYGRSSRSRKLSNGSRKLPSTAAPKSRFVRYLRHRTLATSSLPNCDSRRSVFASRLRRKNNRFDEAANVDFTEFIRCTERERGAGSPRPDFLGYSHGLKEKIMKFLSIYRTVERGVPPSAEEMAAM